MTKRFVASIIIANFIMGLFLYLASQAMLLHLASTHPYLTLTGVNIDKIYIGAVQASSSPIPLIITAYPNFPFYVLWLPLIVNAYFIIKVSRSSTMAKRFPVFISVANIVMGLLTFLSSQTVLLSLVAIQQNYQGIGGVNFWSFSTAAVSVGGSPVPLVIIGRPNLPSYAFLLLLIVNAYFIIRLQRSKISN
jgi:hypothetical protein